MADVNVVDNCHGDTSPPADAALADASEAEICHEDMNSVHRDSTADVQQTVDTKSDVQDTVIPSPDEDTESGAHLYTHLYYESRCVHTCVRICIIIQVFAFSALICSFFFCVANLHISTQGNRWSGNLEMSVNLAAIRKMPGNWKR